MKYLFSLLKKHLREDFDFRMYGSVMLFCAVFFIAEYPFRLVKENIIAYPNPLRFPLYVLLFASLYYGTLLIMNLNGREKGIFSNRAFLLKSFIAILITAFDQSYYVLSLFKAHVYESDEIRAAVISIATHSVAIISVMLPLVLYYVFVEKDKTHGLYGLHIHRDVMWKPYLQVLTIAFVLVGIGIFTSGMGSYYPVYARSGIVRYHEVLGLSRPLALGIFETVYASDFISVELFFRGFLVVGLMRFLGPNAILPMASCYMAFHFGKPPAETGSSFFGGYILGVFAYRSGNIWGGVLAHMGIALFMELVAGLLKAA